MPSYWELRHGTVQAPIVIQAADGPRSARLEGDVNMFDCSYVYFIDLDVVPSPPGDALHYEQCDHILLRGVHASGGARAAQETLKANQSRHLFIEDCDLHGAFDNAIDFVAVQYGHIVRSRIHDSQSWACYVKGGSAYITLEGNELYDAGEGGFTAGQGTGFEFMVPPWIHYEAYDVRFVNNVVHDTDGAGMGVNGGYNVLLAYNTLFNVGARSHSVEVTFGSRTCDGNVAVCRSYQLASGWGPTGSSDEPIPNRNVFVYNNIVYNPAGQASRWQHFFVPAPRAASSGTNIPSPARSDVNLQIRGNLIWNGAALPLGIEDPTEGCQSSNPTCNLVQLLADNSINTLEPELVDPTGGDYRPRPGGNVSQVSVTAIPDFGWSDAPLSPAPPPGSASNALGSNRAGAPRSARDHPGAY
jgi:hypothetical protein